MAKTVFTFEIKDFDLKVIMNLEEQNIHINNSYKVTSSLDMNKVLDIIMGKSFFKKMAAAGYDRTKESLLREWRAHNFLYDRKFKVNRTQDVDLDLNESLLCRFCYFFLSLLYKGE